MSIKNLKSCWIITDGSAGMVNQCLGVAESLNLSIEQKIIHLRAPWKWVTPYIRLSHKFSLSLTPQSSPLEPPYPDLIIACGRRVIESALWIKKASQQKTKIIYIQNPFIHPKHFDAVIAPQHDHISGQNVIQTLGAPHRITDLKLQEAKEKFPEFTAIIPNEKIIGVLIGGPCGAYAMEDESVRTFVRELRGFVDQGFKLLISPSRRTPQRVINILREQLNNRIYLWDREGENPYFAILAHADALFVTCDSVCMITEACITNKPVYLLPLKGGSQRLSFFHDALIAQGRIKWWNKQGGDAATCYKTTLSFDSAKPLNENEMIIGRLHEIL